MADALYEYNGPAYCEGKSPLAIKNLIADGSRLEIGNCLTSLFMVAFSLYGLFASNNEQETLVRLLWASLFYTGLGSAIYHGTANSLFASLDGLPMLMIIAFGLVALFDEIVYEKTNRKYKHYVKNFLALLFMGVFLASIMGEQYGKGTSFFRVSFAIPLVVFVITMIYVYVRIDDFYDAKKIGVLGYNGDVEIRAGLRSLIVRAWVSVVIAFGCWLLDLLLCKQSGYALLFGHWVWHILIGYFAVCLITLLNYLQGNNAGKDVVLIWEWKGIIPRSYYL